MSQFARLSGDNPYVGTFAHAPSAGNRGSAFFGTQVMSVAEQERRKKIRHSPYTGVMYRGALSSLPSRASCPPNRRQQPQAQPRKKKLATRLRLPGNNRARLASADVAAAASAAVPELLPKPRAQSFSSFGEDQDRVPAAELRELLRMPLSATDGREKRPFLEAAAAAAGSASDLRTAGFASRRRPAPTPTPTPALGVSEAKRQLREAQRSLNRRPRLTIAAAEATEEAARREGGSFARKTSPRLLQARARQAAASDTYGGLISPAGSWLPQTLQAHSIQRQYSDSGATTGSGSHNGSDGSDSGSAGGAASTQSFIMARGGEALASPYYVREMEVNENYACCNQTLGSGSFATVIQATHRATGRVVAVKNIDKRLLFSDEDKLALVREIELHARLKHRNIVRLYEVYENASTLSLVLELAGGSLYKLLQRKRRLPPPLACALTKQLLTALSYLHQHGVLHSDIKPHNMLLCDGDGGVPLLKLCDFGLARKVPNARYFKLTGDVHKVPFTGMCGTEGYIAPELLQEMSYGKPADLWSVGVVLHEMLVGSTPFYPVRKCLEQPVDLTGRLWSKVPAMAKDLLAALLTVDPARRLTAAAALAHPWFEGALN